LARNCLPHGLRRPHPATPRRHLPLLYGPQPAVRRQLPQQYNVSYIIIGTEERVFGTPAGLAKFDHMSQLQKVFTSGPYAIYHVVGTEA
jgi:hypothetical protein